MEHIKKPPFSSEVPTTTKIHSSNGANLKKTDAKSLEEENNELKDQILCKICMDKDVSIVFLPCGHLVSCDKCAPALKNCPICRNEIKSTVQTFMS